MILASSPGDMASSHWNLFPEHFSELLPVFILLLWCKLSPPMIQLINFQFDLLRCDINFLYTKFRFAIFIILWYFYDIRENNHDCDSSSSSETLRCNTTFIISDPLKWHLWFPVTHCSNVSSSLCNISSHESFRRSQGVGCTSQLHLIFIY